jgi:pyruvate dehydrogenase E1 component
VIAASDYMHMVPEQIAKWVSGRLVTLGTDGFGRSDSREELRRHFEVDAEHIAFAAISTLAREGTLDKKTVSKAVKELGIDPEKIDPVRA